MGFLQEKRALIVGLLNDHSIAYGIAKAMKREGAQLAFTYQNDKLKDRVTKLAAEFESSIVIPCDVSNDTQITQVFEALKKHWDTLDIIVHSVAFTSPDQLDGDYMTQVTREGFRIAHDISSYSLVALAKAGLPMMDGRNGALIAISYLGAERAAPNYNVMGLAKASLEANVRYMANSILGIKGIRVNAISAGPVRTVSASGVKGLRRMLDYNEKSSPLKRNVSPEDIGNTAAFLCSDLAAGITGEVVHVDAGYHCVALGGIDREEM